MQYTGNITKIFSMGKNFLIVYLLLVAFFILSLTAVCSLPDDPIRNNIKDSLPIFELEGDYPRIAGKQRSNGLDNWADSVMLNIIYNIDNNNPLESAVRAKYYSKDTTAYYLNLGVISLKALIEENKQPNVEYSRYWQGYMVIIRPLLVFTTHSGVRQTMQMAFYFLFALIVALLTKRLSVGVALAFSISMVMINLPLIPLSIQFSSVFFVAFSFMIIILLFPGISSEKAALLFFVIGAFTSFVDLLTAPLVTFGLPVVVLLILRKKKQPESSFKEDILFLVFISLSWSMGYIILWGSKWLLASLVADQNIVLEAVNHAFFWTGHGNGAGGESGVILPLDGLVNNIGVLYTYSISLSGILYILTPCLFLLIFYRWHRKRADLKLTLLLILVGLTPYIWFILTSNHSFVHSWFTYRIQVVTIFSFLCAFSYSIDWEKIIVEIKQAAVKKTKI